MASPDTTRSYAELLREQARELTALRVRAGSPSLRDIEKRARRLFPDESVSLPLSTLSGILNGGYVGRDKLLCLVRTFLSWDRTGRECDPPTYGDPALDVWHDRWEALTTARPPRPRTQPPEPARLSATEAEPPANPGVPRQAASGGSVLLARPPDRFEEAGVLTTARNPVTAVAISPDGTLLAVGCGYGRVRLWNAITRQRIQRTLTGHGGRGSSEAWISSVAFSPDGSLLAAGDSGGRVRLWNPVTCQPIGKSLTAHTGRVETVAFSPDGTLLATGGTDFRLQLWNPTTRRPRGQPLRTRPFAIHSTAFSPDGNLLAVGTNYGTLELWNPSTRRLLTAFTSHKNAVVTALAFSPDGNLLATGSGDCTVRLYSRRAEPES
ncbi:WD40 repeat domain-containing protein [Streptomyces sp. NPDC101132]|uniref:WD40 repeat domain-containing protein n=1 Tax=Streptomyces sp. NPDC101132 TaxID=3366110 RepID=UPI00382E2CAA